MAQEDRSGSLRDKVTKIESWVKSVDDPIAGPVMRMYYLEGKAWMEIADTLGYPGNPDYPRICIRDKYLKNMGIT